jgi:predicted dehydrogenase
MEQKKDETATPNSRRSFLKAAGTTVAGVVVSGLATGASEPRAAEAAPVAADTVAGGVPVPKADAAKMEGGKFPKGTVLAKGRVLGANDRILIGFVGTGGQGGYHVRNFADDSANRNTIPMAVCDVYKPRRESNGAYINKKLPDVKVQLENDYRKLLENKDIDCVMIATPEHWHCQVAVHAMQAGKHVYIEKPFSRYLDEAFQVLDVAKETGKVVQIGAQRSSQQKYHIAGEAVRAGKIGPLVMGQDAYCRNSGGGEWNYGIDKDASPDNLDWDLWLGSAPKRGWNDESKARFFRYRKYWDYSAGILGDLMPHILHPFLIASGNPEYPVRVTSTGTRKVSTDRDVNDTVQILAEFPSGWTMVFLGSTVNEVGLPPLIRGHKGTLYFGGGDVEVRPERPFSEEVQGEFLVRNSEGESVPAHEKNWLDCIRNPSKTPNCNVDLATKVQTIVSLAEMSQRLSKTMLFDEKTRKWRAG